MAGILNNKERIIDFIFTNIGKNKLINNELEISYASLSDSFISYDYELINGKEVALDASDRLTFEASQNNSDNITLELNSELNFSNLKTNNFVIDNDKVFLKKNNKAIEILSGSSILNESENLLFDLYDNFENLRILKSEDLYSDSNDFLLNTNRIDFNYIRDLKTYKSDDNGISKLDIEDSVLSDKRIKNSSRFKFLPPVNTQSETSFLDKPVLANYKKYGEFEEYSFEEILKDLKDRQKFDIEFYDTSLENNNLIQMFEFSTFGFNKLITIYAGTFEKKINNEINLNSVNISVYFIGKIIKESDNQKFYNIFTLLIEE